ncbi:bifunctional lysine-specific demethylase and histidyl-hydroxylase NO66 [Anticarsia gemmatalis]|uniref:bifunctional lysine-specific demethylase and histidyl-hydroxylase NO66 n=1 Tax=Anticarsia gemmatalis TaxID=129554 RepID=UPI003F76BD79
MDSEQVSAFAMYKSNKSSNQAKKQKKRNKSRNLSSSQKIPSKLNVDEASKDIAKQLKRKQEKAKETKNIMKKKQHKKKKNKSKAKKSNSEKKISKKTEREEIPVLVHVPVSNKFPIESETEIEESVTSHYVSRTSNISGASNRVTEASNDHVYEVSDIGDTTSEGSDGSLEFVPVQTNSVEEGLKVFKWMIAPYDPDEFLKRVWEKKPLHIARNKPEYYKEILSTPAIDDMLRKDNIQFTKNIDVTSYVDGQKKNHNPDGRAHPHLVWDFYLNGCSVRLLNPQTFIPKIHLLSATMQEFFNSFVGANAYLTPPDSQGFAPHYDDIEAFIIQTEGKKHWRIYKPLDEDHVLPRVSSKNFDQSEIGEPILEVTLEAGDMLYFPRGYIHQAVTVDGEHSLHVTVSMYQKHAWADLFEKLIPGALQIAINENVELRKGLPFEIYDNFGLVHSDSQSPIRKQIADVVVSLFDKIRDYLPIDAAVDEMSKNYQQAALPPVLTDMEKAVTVFGDSDVMIENGKVTNRVEISLDTKIRLLRKNILRMVSEDRLKIYYHVENSLEYNETEVPYFELEEDLAPAIETLIVTYPEYVSVENLDLPNDSEKLQIADALWSRGLVMTEYPLENIDDD